MIVKSLELQNYRNYESLNCEFYPGINILYGDNAQGKTNILESIYLCGTSKSHRGSKDKEMIQFGYEESHVRINMIKNEIQHKIDIHLKKNKTKGVAIDGLTIKKYSELFGLFHVIFFSPEDLGIIKNGPSERRRFMNMELCQLDKLYLYNMTKYNKIIKQRNNLLKQLNYHPDLLETLDIWDEQLVSCGKYIIKARTEFIAVLNRIIKKIHNHLTGDKEKIEILYEQDVNEKEFLKQLKRRREMDIRYQSTQTGPHRDDISFIVNDVDIRKFGSQGQQRTTALSLKLSEIELVKSIIKDTPVLLLDDVLSELDNHRKSYLLDSISDIQTIISCTGLDEFLNSRVSIDNIYYVENGKIEKKDMEVI